MKILNGKESVTQKIRVGLLIKGTEKKTVIFICPDNNGECDECYNCMYEHDYSDRKRLRTCCGSDFCRKADYYMHCQKEHSETGSFVVMFKSKYNIKTNSKPAPFRMRSIQCKRVAYNITIRRPYFGKMFITQTGKSHTKPLHNLDSRIYRGYAWQDITEIYFYAKNLYSRDIKTDIKEEPNKPVIIRVPSNQEFRQETLTLVEVTDSDLEKCNTGYKEESEYTYNVYLEDDYSEYLYDELNDDTDSLESCNFKGESSTVLDLYEQTADEYCSDDSDRLEIAETEDLPNDSLIFEACINIRVDSAIEATIIARVQLDYLNCIIFDMFTSL